MKIVITATKEDVKGEIDPRFARSNYWYVYNTEPGSGSFYNNLKASEMAHGVGVYAASKLIDMKADVLISKSVGPKAFEILQKNSVKMYKADSSKSIEENIKLYKNNELQEISTAGEPTKF